MEKTYLAVVMVNFVLAGAVVLLAAMNPSDEAMARVRKVALVFVGVTTATVVMAMLTR